MTAEEELREEIEVLEDKIIQLQKEITELKSKNTSSSQRLHGIGSIADYAYRQKLYEAEKDRG